MDDYFPFPPVQFHFFEGPRVAGRFRFKTSVHFHCKEHTWGRPFRKKIKKKETGAAEADASEGEGLVRVRIRSLGVGVVGSPAY